MNYLRTDHIAAGNFKTGKRSPAVLQAYLGTCLGVAIYDRHAKIGGLIHILLPEPPGTTATESPEKYAATGIPLFISEMLNLGAKRENMEATIAGGALVGPVTQLDINLDIGGRSADIADAILTSAGIKILNSETGGFFSCTLELNMETGEAAISPAWEDIANTRTDFTPPTIEDIHQTIEALNPIPQTALKIIRMVQDDRYDMDNISDVLSKDQVLSAQTLKICNSALFAGGIKIDTLKEAVLLLGQDMLVKSVITAAVDNYFNQTVINGYSLCRGGLFFHAVGTAVMAEKIAARYKKSTPKHAYTAGLLHDIGKVVLDQFISKGSPLFFREFNNTDQTALSSEKKMMGINHCETGRFLAKMWHFSSALNDVIAFHHSPKKSKDNTDLVCIVYLADLLLSKFSTGLEHEKMHPGHLDFVLKQLGIPPQDLESLADAIPNNEQLKLL